MSPSAYSTLRSASESPSPTSAVSSTRGRGRGSAALESIRVAREKAEKKAGMRRIFDRIRSRKRNLNTIEEEEETDEEPRDRYEPMNAAFIEPYVPGPLEWDIEESDTSNIRQPPSKTQKTGRHLQSDDVESVVAARIPMRRYPSPPGAPIRPERSAGPPLRWTLAPNMGCRVTGVMFGNLAPIPTNPAVDPPPGGCFNCWMRGHDRKDCRSPKTTKFCYNCGRLGVGLRSCPRCATAHLRYLAILREQGSRRTANISRPSFPPASAPPIRPAPVFAPSAPPTNRGLPSQCQIHRPSFPPTSAPPINRGLPMQYQTGRPSFPPANMRPPPPNQTSMLTLMDRTCELAYSLSQLPATAQNVLVRAIYQNGINPN